MIAALKELRATEGPGFLEKLVTVAEGALERILGARLPDAEAELGAPLGEKAPIGIGGTREPVKLARKATEGSGTEAPFRDRIQASFGRHDVSGVRAHIGGPAATASAQLGARAFATGDRIAFAEQPDLHTAAHEMAHVVQQRGGVQLKGIDTPGDANESHADSVADTVVRGESAESLLDRASGSGTGTPASASAVQRDTKATPPGTGSIGKDDVDKVKPTYDLDMVDAKGYLEAKTGPWMSNQLFYDNVQLPWEAGSAHPTTFNKEVVQQKIAKLLLPGNAEQWALLTKMIGSAAATEAVNRGREADEYGMGSRRWHKDAVAQELWMKFLPTLHTSLKRVMQRYLGQRAGLYFRTKAGNPEVKDAPEINSTAIVPSHPMDKVVIEAFLSQPGLISTDWDKYGEDHPDARFYAEGYQFTPRPIKLATEPDYGNKRNWVTADPPNATKEEVAQALFGDTAYAYAIVDAAPRFGFTLPEGVELLEPYKTAYGPLDQKNWDYSPFTSHAQQGELAQGTRNGEIDEPLRTEVDPAREIVGDRDGTAAMQAQARKYIADPSTLEVVLARLGTITTYLAECVQSCDEMQFPAPLIQMIKRTMKRHEDLKAGEIDVADWNTQSIVQLEVVSGCRDSLKALVGVYKKSVVKAESGGIIPI
ncbi:MAG: DUF4157 domain-containing protein, partial [Deltaproteobacteria bacterium]|nr:DUF4157 domain-containing protein [Deltaproteobacteria bacterium]